MCRVFGTSMLTCIYIYILMNNYYYLSVDLCSYACFDDTDFDDVLSAMCYDGRISIFSAF